MINSRKPLFLSLLLIFELNLFACNLCSFLLLYTQLYPPYCVFENHYCDFFRLFFIRLNNLHSFYYFSKVKISRFCYSDLSRYALIGQLFFSLRTVPQPGHGLATAKLLPAVRLNWTIWKDKKKMKVL